MFEWLKTKINFVRGKWCEVAHWSIHRVHIETDSLLDGTPALVIVQKTCPRCHYRTTATYSLLHETAGLKKYHA